MQSEEALSSLNTARASFFDDDDLTKGFEFAQPEKRHFKFLKAPAIIRDSLIRYSSATDISERGFYALHTRVLALYEKETSKAPTVVMDLSHSRLEVNLESENQNYYFSVARNGNTYKFYSTDRRVIENWIAVLKSICVLSNFHEEYKALKMIGKGSFAKVYLVESKSNRKHYAVKAFTKEGVIASNKGNAKPSMLNEVDVMRAIDHENVIKLYEVYETEKSIYLVLELIQGKSLQEMLKKQAFKEEGAELKIINIIRSLLDALAYLSSKGIMHRDLKPDNILIDKGDKVKVVDFGLSTFIDVPEYIFKKCGTPGYIAPEVFKYDQKSPSTHYSGLCDVFSIGCILYYMYFGTAFFEGTNASEILKCNRKFTIEYEPINNVKKELKDPNSKINKDGLTLLLQLMEFDQKRRISAAQALNHTFFIPIPMGLQKIPGFNEISGDAPQRSNSHSPSLSPLKRMSTNSMSPDKYSPTHGARFMNKDSLYLDVGRPELNGRVDTINSGGTGGTHTSMQFAQRVAELNHSSQNSSNASSPSPFGRKSIMGEHARRSSGKGFGSFGNNQNVLKAAIYRNMQTNGEETKDESTPHVAPKIKLEQIKTEKRHRTGSDQTSFNQTHSTVHERLDKLRGAGSQSPPHQHQKTDSTASGDSSPFSLRVEQVQASFPGPTSKLIHVSTRKYQPFNTKS